MSEAEDSPKKKQGFWNLPNTLTVLRVLAVPFMVVVLDEDPSRLEAIGAALLFIGAMITDIIDGWLARRWGLESVAGAFLDPLADKLMVATTLVMLVWQGWLPPWMAALIIGRELTITALRTVALSEGLHMPADTLGKFKTAFQSTAIAFLLWHYPSPTWLGKWIVVNTHSVGIVLAWIAMFFTIASATNYLWVFFKHASRPPRA